LDASQFRRLKKLEAKNAMLKQKYADIALENKILKKFIEKRYNCQKLSVKIS